MKAEVCLHFHENPHESIRRGAAAFDSSPSTAWKTLRKEAKFHPYKMAVHQRLHDGDAERCKAFCIQMLDRINADPDCTIASTDKICGEFFLISQVDSIK